MSEVQHLIVKKCREIEQILLDKNRKYGNAALSPVSIFSHAGVQDRIAVRLDEKLARIAADQSDDTEDSRIDLIGYLILSLISYDIEREKSEQSALDISVIPEVDWPKPGVVPPNTHRWEPDHYKK